MTGDKELFSIETPLGFVVHTTERYWQQIVVKHPDLAHRLHDVKVALSNPDEIRRSSRDDAVFLFYHDEKKSRWVVAVAKRQGGKGFLVTAYRTDAVKEGEKVWPK
ncbi:MAG: hypothetical protein L6Q71_00405 [Planctomycetes bacterium]|nr:hypothetical protein [Planctomycetota bacterium]NUQ34650.1 hypothetical protein [Planctomycetaceae bacterium]